MSKPHLSLLAFLALLLTGLACQSGDTAPAAAPTLAAAVSATPSGTAGRGAPPTVATAALTPSPTPNSPQAVPQTPPSFASPPPSTLDPLEARLAQMSVAEKVGQLLLAGFEGASASGAEAAIRDLHAGGILLVGNTASADHARQLTADLQTLGRRHQAGPLLIAVDHEGGVVQRIRQGVVRWEPNWSVGRLQPEAALAEACRRGVGQGK
ncbi:MAG: hypothetical protein NTZ05_01670, partial [Chloroflexi bacterium]|nr:hypothetical protein [Chloroflexota bacterium]